jgi:hypothetical protein
VMLATPIHFQAAAHPSAAAGYLFTSRPRHRSQTGNLPQICRNYPRTGIDQGRHPPVQA